MMASTSGGKKKAAVASTVRDVESVLRELERNSSKRSKSKDEFAKRAAFALLACLALHGRGEDEDYLKAMPLIEKQP